MPARKKPTPTATGLYVGLVDGIGELLEAARRAKHAAALPRRTRGPKLPDTVWQIG